jgi:predicted MFS family arabinose efflux permease
MSNIQALALESPDRAQTRGAARATRAFFLIAGLGTATWAPMVPLAKARLALDEAQLGVVLLCMGIGSVVAMPVAGFLSHRFGNRIVMVTSGLLVCVALPALSLAPSAAALAAILVGFGATMGVLDVSMNAHAVDVEQRHGRPLMSGFHGLYSAGGLVGAAGMSVLLGTGAPLYACAAVVSVALAAIVAAERPRLLVVVPHDAAAPRSPFTVPSGRALALGMLCLVVFLAEGAMLDWSAVFLRSARGFSISGAGLGYAGFSIAMATGRLLGYRITAALGPARVVRLGGLVAAAGFALATALPWAATSLAGFVLVGLGASNIVPVLFSAAGRLSGPSVGMAIATVTSLGYAGMLAGPAVIGFVADASSLALALGGIAGLLLGVAICAPIVRDQEALS